MDTQSTMGLALAFLLPACGTGEPNRLPAAYDMCPLTMVQARDHVNLEGQVATPDDQAFWETATAAWKTLSTGRLRNLQGDSEASGVQIRAELANDEAFTVRHYIFDDASWDRSALEALDPGWSKVAHLPCDYTQYLAPSSLTLQFDDGAPWRVDGSLEAVQGQFADDLAFTGTADGADWTDLHPVLASLTAPAQVALYVTANPTGVFGTATVGNETWVEFGQLDASSPE